MKNMELMDKRVIVNVSVGSEDSWYHKGAERLLASLNKQKNKSDYLFTSYEHSNYNNPYSDKVMAIYDAMLKGYDYILYLDCSITAIKNTEPIWKEIEEKGYYLYESGYNLAQTCNDNCLRQYEVTRDEAETMKEAATNVVGISLNHPTGKRLIQMMVDSIKNEAIDGLKWPNEQQRVEESSDPRFQFHRQDQSVISLAANILSMNEFDQHNHFVMRDEDGNKPSKTVIFKLKGGF